MIALDVGDRAIELALKAAPVRNIQQEIGIRRGLQFLDSRPRLRQLDLKPPNREFSVLGRDRQPGRRPRWDCHPPSALRTPLGLHHAAFSAFWGTWGGSPGFLLHGRPWET